SPSGRLLAVDAAGDGVVRPRRPILAAVAGAAGLVVGALLWAALAPRGTRDEAPRCVTISTPRDLSVVYATVTPDARTVIAIGRPKDAGGGDATQPHRLYTRTLDSYEFKAIPGTEGADRFLPDLDGRGVLFVAPVSPGAPQRRVAHVPLDGSAPPTTV